MITKTEVKTDAALSSAYDYMLNVTKTQQRCLSADDMYSGYKSMGFTPQLTEHIFEDFYYQTLNHWIDIGMLREGANNEKT